MGIWQRAQQGRINDAEEGSGDAEPDRQGQDGDKREGPVFEQEPHAVPGVLQDGFHDATSSHVVAAVLHQREIAEPSGRRAPGVVSAQPLPFVLLRPHLQVKLHLVPDLSGDDIASDKRTTPRENVTQDSHGP
jgi:hypothetical protein